MGEQALRLKPGVADGHLNSVGTAYYLWQGSLRRQLLP
jgi:hypothetical protein